jgi:hypothetical protein
MKVVVALLQGIRLATENEHEGSSNVAHVQRLIVLVKYQYRAVHPAESFRIRIALVPLRTRYRMHPLRLFLKPIVTNVPVNTKSLTMKFLFSPSFSCGYNVMQAWA